MWRYDTNVYIVDPEINRNTGKIESFQHLQNQNGYDIVMSPSELAKNSISEGVGHFTAKNPKIVPIER